MDENHQDKTKRVWSAPEDKLWLPTLSLKDQKKLKHLQKKPFAERTGLKGKTLWDWLQLLGILAIPLVVAGATLFFGIQQANLANQQHEADQQSALDQQQAAILQTYIDNIQDLLLHDNLRGSKPSDEVAILARARTLTALQGLDTERKGRLLIFLHEAELIGFDDKYGKTHDPIINLSGANLNSASLSFADLSNANLSDAGLNGADLSNANLSNAGLNFANLSYAHLKIADLSYADLSYAQNLTQQQLDQVDSCKNAILPKGLICHHN